jgi:hypothetical protein
MKALKFDHLDYFFQLRFFRLFNCEGGIEFDQKYYFFQLRFFRLFKCEGVLNLSKSTISFGLGFSDYLIMRGIEICTKLTMILATACILFNYEKTEKRHFGNIFTPFGVGEFTG